MSQENVELVRALVPGPDVDLAQLFRDDAAWADATAVGEVFSRDVEFVRTEFEKTVTYKGPGGLRAAWLDWLTPWASYRAEMEEFIDCGECVLQLSRAYGRLKGSDLEVSREIDAVWTIRDGKVARFEVFLNRAKALQAAGLAD